MRPTPLGWLYGPLGPEPVGEACEPDEPDDEPEEPELDDPPMAADLKAENV